MTDRFDAIVVGTGFGGLGAALRLAESGRRVMVLERVTYPGGCACTFDYDGNQFEGGATLFSGFGEGQLFRRWIDRHQMDVQAEHLDRPLELRAGPHRMSARRDRAELIAEFTAIDGAPVKALRMFFRLQERVASALWPTLDDPKLALPLSPMRALRHLARVPSYLPLVRLTGRSLWTVLERFGLSTFGPLVAWLDAQCQITVQCGVREAEAPFALAALDYHHRGAVHVKGGIGSLAWGMVRAIEALEGTVRFAAPVKKAIWDGDQWTVRAPGGEVTAPHVIFNALPGDAARIAGIESRGLSRLAGRVASGWSASMLFRTVRPPASAGRSAQHLELVRDPAQPLLEGNHVFMSIGADGEGVACTGHRRMTLSTHIDPSKIRVAAAGDGGRAYVDEVHARMRQTVQSMAPEWNDIVSEFTGSARTFRRWTGRSEGFVGGIPRRAGLRQYLDVFGHRFPKGFHLVGDSVFPGQSTLATAVGGVRVADRVCAQLK